VRSATILRRVYEKEKENERRKKEEERAQHRKPLDGLVRSLYLLILGYDASVSSVSAECVNIELSFFQYFMLASIGSSK